MYVIYKIQRGRRMYVKPQGSARSYTYWLEYARKYPTREAAEADRCPENEYVTECRY